MNKDFIRNLNEIEKDIGEVRLCDLEKLEKIENLSEQERSLIKEIEEYNNEGYEFEKKL